jgi:hypothetical protein
LAAQLWKGLFGHADRYQQTKIISVGQMISFFGFESAAGITPSRFSIED